MGPFALPARPLSFSNAGAKGHFCVFPKEFEIGAVEVGVIFTPNA
jgi:hypothetical protein